MIPYLLLAPAMIGLAVFNLYPMVGAILSSLHAIRFSSGSPDPIFVGLQNYLDLASDPGFWNSVRVTLLFNLVANPVQILVALLLALALSTRPRGTTVVQSIFMIPFCVSLVVAVITWRTLLGPNALVNGILSAVGLPTQPFYQSASQALWTIAAIAIWAGVSFWALVILAGIRAINPEILEAAEVDGASYRQRVVQVTVPLLRRTLLFALVISTAGNLLLFSPVILITLGGPEKSTDLLMFKAYEASFSFGQFGTGNAIVVVLLLLMIVFAAVQFRWLRTDE